MLGRDAPRAKERQEEDRLIRSRGIGQGVAKVIDVTIVVRGAIGRRIAHSFNSTMSLEKSFARGGSEPVGLHLLERGRGKPLRKVRALLILGVFPLRSDYAVS